MDMQKSIYAEFARQSGTVDSTWFRNHAYDPPFLRIISEQEQRFLIDWHEAVAQEYPNAGASGVEMMTMLSGLIMGSGISRIVQCGHYVGFSTLLMGFIGRYMGLNRFLYTVDIDPKPSEFTLSWVQKAGLADDIFIAVKDSSDPSNVDAAAEFLGGAPQLIYIDSSHQYQHTLKELALWWDALPPGGLIIMDDVSLWASEFDRTQEGGSHRAALQFRQTVAANGVILNANLAREMPDPYQLIYTDICGFGLIQKPY